MCVRDDTQLSVYCREIISQMRSIKDVDSSLPDSIAGAFQRLEEMLAESSRYADYLVSCLEIAVGQSRDDAYDIIYAAIDTHKNRRSA